VPAYTGCRGKEVIKWVSKKFCTGKRKKTEKKLTDRLNLENSGQNECVYQLGLQISSQVTPYQQDLIWACYLYQCSQTHTE